MNKGPLKYDLDLFLAGLKARSSYYGPHSNMPGEYNFRWENFGHQQPIDVPLPPQPPGHWIRVKKGHLVIYDPGMKKFSFTCLPSPLLENDLNPREVVVSHPVNCGWDFCPSLGLLVVGTRNGDGCVCLEVPAIQCLLTVRTRSFSVQFRHMHNGQEYRPDLLSPVLEGTFSGVELQLTSHRLAAKVLIDRPSLCKVILWNWESGHRYSVGVSCFIPLPKTRWSHGSAKGGRL